MFFEKAGQGTGNEKIGVKFCFLKLIPIPHIDVPPSPKTNKNPTEIETDRKGGCVKYLNM
jgi:hypothetical protein